MKRKLFSAIYMAFVVSLVFASTAQAAYIDPNTGGMLFQVLAVLFGLFSGILLFFSSQVKKGFYRLTRALRGKESPSSDDEPDQGAEGN
ncbi:MAG: hypothetical protein ABFS03_10835 [Chloroflexota bacterium]